MRRLLDNNKLSKEELTFSLAHFIEGGEEGKKQFLVKDVKENFAFEEDAGGKKRMTDKFVDTTITVVDLDTYAQFKVKVEKQLPLTHQQIINENHDFYATLDLTTTVVKIWKIDFSGASVSIKTSDIIIEKA